MEPITALYVPGDRPDRFDKAAASGADLVILDLEDAVAPARKHAARSAVTRWLGTSPGIPVQVRVNDAADIEALSGLAHPFELRLPKIDSAGRLDELADAVGSRPVTALIESALGVENAVEIARHPLVAHIALGESDLASDVGSTAPAVIDYARTRVLFAAAAAGLPAPMLSAFPDIRDVDALRADTERGRAMGWYGRTAIHPSQLAVIAEVFHPSDAELAWAQAVLDAVAGGGVSTLASGEMVDAAMVGRARRILSRAVER